MMKQIKVYVAGKYNDNNIVSALDNMREGMRAGLEVLLAGFVPFVPWFDYHFQLNLRDGETLTDEDYKRYSMVWLEVCDAVLVLPSWISSEGTKAEIRRAIELDMPIFFNLKQLKYYFNGGVK
jgi:hypothetical protein